jgi:hypothetical protein
MNKKLSAPYRFHVSKQPWGWQWKHQTEQYDPIYERHFYELDGVQGLIYFLEDRYGSRFSKKALATML